MRYQPTLIQLNRAEGVGYEGRATIKLQSGITYSTIELETNIVKRETIKRVAIDVNGNEIVYASAVELDLVDQVLKKHRATGRVILDLARFEYRSIAGIRQKELVTLPTDDVTLIVEFGAKDAADPTTPTKSNQDGPNPTKLLVLKLADLTGFSSFAGYLVQPSRLRQHKSFRLCSLLFVVFSR